MRGGGEIWGMKNPECLGSAEIVCVCGREGSAPEKLQDYLEREGAAGSDGKTWEKKRESDGEGETERGRENMWGSEKQRANSKKLERQFLFD